MDNSSIKRFKTGLLLHSESDHYSSALSEWEHVETYMAEEEETCLWGYFIREHCVIRNIFNRKKQIAGNCCIKKFTGINTSKDFDATRRLQKDITKPLNPECLQEARNNGIINHYEHKFYVDTWRSGTLTQKQRAFRISINEKILNAKRIRIVLEKICVELHRFSGLDDVWISCDGCRPGEIAIKLKRLGNVWIPVKGKEFLDWIRDPELTTEKVFQTIHNKQKSLSVNRLHYSN